MTAEDFYGDLETLVLQLMGFDLKYREDELHYYRIMDRLLEIDVKEFRENLDRLATEMYKNLLKKSIE